MRVIITGASQGLGHALTNYFLKNGDIVGAISRSRVGIKHSNLFECTLNLADDANVIAPLSELIDEMGGVDVLINNANYHVNSGLMSISLQDWEKSILTGVTSAFKATRGVLPFMLSSKQGFIINISSISTKIDLERGISYSASKASINYFSRSLVSEFHRNNIKVTTLYLGAVNTGDLQAEWKMMPIDVFNAIKYIVNNSSNYFFEEVVMRPIMWPE